MADRRLIDSRLLVLAVLLLTLAAPAFAQTRPSSTPASAAAPIESQAVQRTRPAAATSDDNGVNWPRLAMAMIVVLGLIVALKYLAGWLMPSAGLGVGGRGVRLLARTPIAPRQQVLLLHVGRRVLVVGDSAGTLSPLANIDQPDEVAELLGQVSTFGTPTAAGRFKSMFGRAGTAYETSPDEPTSATPVADDGSDAQDDPNDPAARDPRVAEAQHEINGLLDRMRSLSKTTRR